MSETSSYESYIPFVSSSVFLDDGLTLSSEFVLMELDMTLILLFVLLILPDGCLTIEESVFLPVLSRSPLIGFSWFGLFLLFPPTFLPAEFDGGDANASGSKLVSFPDEEEKIVDCGEVIPKLIRIMII